MAGHGVHDETDQISPRPLITGGSECHRHGTCPQQVPVHCSAASSDQMCSFVCWHGALRLINRLPPSYRLPPVQRLLPHQGSERRHRGVPASCVWVSLNFYGHIVLKKCTSVYSLFNLLYPLTCVLSVNCFTPMLCRKLRPSMMQHLLRRLVFDVPLLNEHTKMPLKVRNASHLGVCSSPKCCCLQAKEKLSSQTFAVTLVALHHSPSIHHPSLQALSSTYLSANVIVHGVCLTSSTNITELIPDAVQTSR